MQIVPQRQLLLPHIVEYSLLQLLLRCWIQVCWQPLLRLPMQQQHITTTPLWPPLQQQLQLVLLLLVLLLLLPLPLLMFHLPHLQIIHPLPTQLPLQQLEEELYLLFLFLLYLLLVVVVVGLPGHRMLNIHHSLL